MSRPQTTTLPSGLVVPWTKDMLYLPEACPDKHEHDPLPADFREASQPSKTHRQTRHKTCGLWTQWTPRER